MCNTSMVTPFKIEAKNEERGQPQASYLRYIKVYLPGDTVVELQKSRKVLVKSISLISVRLRGWCGKIIGRIELLAEISVVIGEWETGANSN